MSKQTPLFKSRAQRDEECQFFMKLHGIDKLLKKPFPTKQFVYGPASANYHGNYPGGLFEHSLTVAKELAKLSAGQSLKWQRNESPFIIGLFHDMCKMDAYQSDPMSADDTWEHNPNILLDGHGEKSVILIQEYIDLTEEEILCIRWHMGAYKTDTRKWNILGKAIEKYPNVLYTHTADMIASHIEGV